jgi:uncharacterized membrane protein YphA (DoxX/SURF4 family)
MKDKILLGLCVLFGLMMVNSGLNKFFWYMPMPDMSTFPQEVQDAMNGLMATKWILPLVAIVEIVGGILIAIPKTRALGAIVILPVTAGILVHHGVLDPKGSAMAVVLMAINLWAIIENKEKYMPMIK